MSQTPFGQRHGLSGPPVGTLVREDVPNGLRTKLIEVLKAMKLTSFGFDFDGIKLRSLFHQVMNSRPPDRSDLLDNGYNAFRETQQLIYDCEWFQFYEIVEELAQLLRKEDGRGRVPPCGGRFADTMNEAFARWSVGWQLVDGKVIIRGDEAFEGTLKTAIALLEERQPTAAGHLRFARDAISVRPQPNTHGAVTHATSAVECVLSEITTGKKKGLSDYLQENPGLFHPALRDGLAKIYAYASDVARHGKEGTRPATEDAEFAVSTCAAVCTLLNRKHAK